MAKMFPDIVRLNDNQTASFASMDSQQIRGTATQIDDFTSASLATIGSGLSDALGKRAHGHIIVTTGSFGSDANYYVYAQTSSGDANISGSEWTTLTNCKRIILGAGGDGGDITLRPGSSAAQYITFADEANNKPIQIKGRHDTKSLSFWTRGAPRMVISQSGGATGASIENTKIGIAKHDPEYTLDV